MREFSSWVRGSEGRTTWVFYLRLLAMGRDFPRIFINCHPSGLLFWALGIGAFPPEIRPACIGIVYQLESALNRSFEELKVAGISIDPCAHEEPAYFREEPLDLV